MKTDFRPEIHRLKAIAHRDIHVGYQLDKLSEMLAPYIGKRASITVEPPRQFVMPRPRNKGEITFNGRVEGYDGELGIVRVYQPGVDYAFRQDKPYFEEVLPGNDPVHHFLLTQIVEIETYENY